MRILTIVCCSLLLAASSNAVISVNLHSSNTGINDFQWSVSGNQITIWEDWSSSGLGTVQFNGLPLFSDYQVTKIITNNSGVDWNSMAIELLDPDGQSNDLNYDITPDPWLPTGYGHSNELDGLSFAQGTTDGKSSDAFSSIYTDPDIERDFFDLYGGTVAGSGGVDRVNFGLRNNNFANEGFILSQRPNEFTTEPIPEPTSMLLFGLGLAGAGAYRRLKQRS